MAQRQDRPGRGRGQEIFAVQGQDITAITIKHPGEEIRLVKEGKDWHLDQPIKERADALTTNALLAALSQMRLNRDLGTEKDLKPFGLDQPPLVVSFKVGNKCLRPWTSARNLRGGRVTTPNGTRTRKC